jgi:hypothetical protein
MILKIKNTNRLVGTMFWNGRFKCLQVHETDTNYRFQFDDSEITGRYVWIEVSKIGHYNRIEQEWEYRLNYMNCPYHVVTAEWFEDYKNVMDTFGSALKNSM